MKKIDSIDEIGSLGGSFSSVDSNNSDLTEYIIETSRKNNENRCCSLFSNSCCSKR